MRFTINVKHYGVLVRDTATSVNQELTRLVRSEADIQLDKIKRILAFQQTSQIQINAPSYTDLLAVVRYDTKKEGQLIWREFRPKGLTPDMSILADDVAPLARYRRGNAMKGVWQFEAWVTFYRPSLLKEFSDEQSMKTKLATLPNYSQIGMIRFSVVIPEPEEPQFDLLPTGELRHDRELRPQDMEVVVDVNNI